MRTPRTITGSELIKKLRKHFDYEITRQEGSHIRVTTQKNGEHHISIPNHKPLKIGTLSAILGDVSEHHKVSKQHLIYLINN